MLLKSLRSSLKNIKIITIISVLARFYRDKIDYKSDKDEYFQFTNDMKDLKEKIETIKVYGGGDGPEDWVGGYDIALNKMEWKKEKSIKLIIYIEDAGVHGEEF